MGPLRSLWENRTNSGLPAMYRAHRVLVPKTRRFQRVRRADGGTRTRDLCMARTGSQTPAKDTNRQIACPCGILVMPAASKGQQPTEKPDYEPDYRR